MKIFLNIEADSPAELDQAIAGLAAKLSAVTQVAATINDTTQGLTAGAAAVEPEKKTRTKKADAPKEEAKTEAEPEKAKADDKPKELTAEEVKNYVIDLLNDWTEAVPSDSEIRVKTLKPILEKVGAAKIGAIDPSKFKEVIDLVDESRVKLAEIKSQSSVEE